MRQIQSVHPGKAISATDFNNLLSEVKAMANLSTEPPLEIVQGQLRLVPQSFWAVIQSKGEASSGPETVGCCQADRFGWQEIQPVGDGTWELLDGGRAGTPDLNPGYELNGNCIDVGSIVRIRPGYESEFLFDQCCSVCNHLIVESSSSTSSSTSSATSSVTSSGISSDGSSDTSSATSSVTSSATSSVTSSGISSATSGSSMPEDFLCIPFMDCDGNCKYLYLPTFIGAYVSDDPCSSSSSSSSSSVTSTSSATSSSIVVSSLGYSSASGSNASHGELIDTNGDATPWTVPEGVFYVEVQCWGGGGGPTQTGTNYACGAGGGGAYAKSLLTVVPGDVLDYQVGLGGGTRVLPTTHVTDGGDSWFINNTTILAKGGKSVTLAEIATGGGGGLAADCIGDIKSSGGAGGNAYSTVYADYPNAGGGGGGGAGGPDGDGSNGGVGLLDGTFGSIGIGNGGSHGVLGGNGGKLQPFVENIFPEIPGGGYSFGGSAYSGANGKIRIVW